jgi:DNA-binding transcriptional LysR family regulator
MDQQNVESYSPISQAEMDLNALKLFVEIVDAGNLSAAARKLQTTRSNVSHRLKAFERALGVQLLRRTTRRVEPTEVGAGLYEHGRSILREMAAADALVSSLRLSVPTGLGHLLVSPLLVAFKRAYPDIRLDVRFDNRVSDLIGEDVDVALRIVSNPPESLVATLLDEVDWVLCAAPDYLAEHGVPKTLEALADHTIVSAPAVGQALRLSAQLGDARTHVTLDPGVSSDNYLFLQASVRAGNGLGILPYYAAADDLRAGHVKRVLPGYRFSVFGSRLYMLAMPSRYRTLATRHLLDFLKDGLQGKLPRLPQKERA